MTPVNALTDDFSPAWTAPLEPMRPTHPAPRQGRPPEPPATAVGGTEARKTMDAVNGAPSLAVSCIPSDLLGPIYVDRLTGRPVCLAHCELDGHIHLWGKPTGKGIFSWYRFRRPTAGDIAEMRRAVDADSLYVCLADWQPGPASDPDGRQNILADQACAALIAAINHLDAHRGADGVSWDVGIKCVERIKSAQVGLHVGGLLANPKGTVNR